MSSLISVEPLLGETQPKSRRTRTLRLDALEVSYNIISPRLSPNKESNPGWRRLDRSGRASDIASTIKARGFIKHLLRFEEQKTTLPGGGLARIAASERKSVSIDHSEVVDKRRFFGLFFVFLAA